MNRNQLTAPAFVLVDDDEDDRLLMRLALEETNSGFPVKEFENGAELLTYLAQEEHLYNDGQIHWLVIMDVNMPIMSGPDALREMQQHPLWQKIPVMMMSTSDDPKLIETLLTMGARSYVVKPKSYTGLLNSIKTTFTPWMQHPD